MNISKHNQIEDVDVMEFADFLITRQEYYPISKAYDKNYGQLNNVHWSNQKDHIILWFESQATTGCGNFKRKELNYSVKKTYARLFCPEALLWIAEAVGVDEKIV